jgi:hypothetical protein
MVTRCLENLSSGENRAISSAWPQIQILEQHTRMSRLRDFSSIGEFLHHQLDPHIDIGGSALLGCKSYFVSFLLKHQSTIS